MRNRQFFNTTFNEGIELEGIYNVEKDNIKKDCSNIKRKIGDKVVKLKKNLKRKSYYKELLLTRIPILKWLFIEYKFKSYFVNDILSGFTVGVMNLPQGMGYSLLAHLPAVNGLYASFFPLLVYAVLGTSRQLAYGTFAIISLLSSGVIDSLTDSYKRKIINLSDSNDTDTLVSQYKISIACSLALLVGIIQLIMGFTGLGMITKYFSCAFISGYTTGGAIHVLVSQLRYLFGIKYTADYYGVFKLPRTVIDIISNLTLANISTVTISVICINVLVLFKELINPKFKERVKFEFPSELILVIIATVISYSFQLHDKFNVDIVNTIPKGFPKPAIPNITFWSSLYKDALLIAIIAFSINILIAMLLANRNKYNINATQELYAYGISNIIGSFFMCAPSAGSLSRSMVMETTGAKTQLSSIFSTIIILFVILWIGPLFEPLPKACLASIIVVALKGLLFQFKDFKNLYVINKYEAMNWFGTFLAVVLLDVDFGLLIGLILSFFQIILKDQQTDLHRLTKLENSTNYIDKELVKVETTEDTTNYCNIEIFKVQSSLYFVNIQSFKERLQNKIDDINSNSHSDNFSYSALVDDSVQQKNNNTQNNTNTCSSEIRNRQTLFILLDFSAVTYIDSDAIKSILEILDDYEKMNIKIYFCESQECFLQRIVNMNLMGKFEKSLFLTVHEALISIKSNNSSININ